MRGAWFGVIVCCATSCALVLPDFADTAERADDYEGVDDGVEIGAGFHRLIAGEPSDSGAADCALLRSDDGGWLEDACVELHAFVCAL